MSENQVTVSTPAAPIGQLKTTRSLLKLILLTIITFGIYPLFFYSGISNDINVIASRYDGKKTMHYLLLYFIVAPITLGIGGLVWNHKLANRVGQEADRRNVGYTISAATFWGWTLLGSLIIVGPFVYIHKLCKCMNLIAADYNEKG